MRRFPLFPFCALALLGFCSAALTGCGIAKAKQDSGKVLARHFLVISTNGYAEALGDYGSQFFQGASKEEWKEALARLTAKLGEYQGHTITAWRVFTKAGTVGSGTTVELQCQVTYSKRSANETFTLFKGMTGSEYKIIGHQIDGVALLKE